MVIRDEIASLVAGHFGWLGDFPFRSGFAEDEPLGGGNDTNLLDFSGTGGEQVFIPQIGGGRFEGLREASVDQIVFAVFHAGEHQITSDVFVANVDADCFAFFGRKGDGVLWFVEAGVGRRAFRAALGTEIAKPFLR